MDIVIGQIVKVDRLVGGKVDGLVTKINTANANPVIDVNTSDGIYRFRIMKDGKAINVRPRACGSPKFVAVCRDVAARLIR